MRILILSTDPWRKDNSFGNTYSNFFGKLEDVEIAHVYLYDGQPDFEPNVKSYFIIPEKEVISSSYKFWKKTEGAGKRVVLGDINAKAKTTNPVDTKQLLYQRFLAFGKRHHWRSLFLARELAWKYGKVNYDSLLDFVNSFNPDLFFLSYNHLYYSNRIALYIKKHIDAPMVMEMAMDHYSLKRISWSLLFWIDRFKKRAMIRRLVKESEMMFVISEKLKKEIENDLNIPCSVLYKEPDESRSYKPYEKKDDIVKFLFTGNIYANRWKTLAMLAKTLKSQQYGKLDIYTATPISKRMMGALSIEGYSEIHPPVSQSEVVELQNDADILVHVEAFDRYNKYLVRCAISTKIMDYLSVGRCILAIGPNDISSIEFLTDSQAALIANNQVYLEKVIAKLKENPNLISQYANKVMEYSTASLNASSLRQDFFAKLQEVVLLYRHNKNQYI